MHGDDVGVSFYHVDAICLDNRAFSLIDAIQLSSLAENLRFRRVDVFLADSFGPVVQYTSTESQNLAANVEPWENHSTPKTVADAAVFYLIAKSGLDQELFLVAFAEGFLGQSVFGGSAVTQLELLDNIVPNSALAEIGQTDGFSIYMVVKYILEIISGIFIDDEEAFADTLRFFLFVGQFAFLDFDVVFLGQPTQGFWIIHLLMFHDEVNGIASFAAGKAFTESFGGRNIERGCLVIVEWTQAHIVDSSFFEGHKFRYHINNLCSIQYPVYGGLVYHCSAKVQKKLQLSFGAKRRISITFMFYVHEILPPFGRLDDRNQKKREGL